MAEELCTIHKNENAVGKCFRCKRPFCLDCLDVDTGQALCPECLKNRTSPAASTPPSQPVPIPSAPKPAALAPLMPQVNAPLPQPLPTPMPQKPAAPAPSPLGGSSPLDFKGKGMDDDPLGLLGSFSAPQAKPPVSTLQPAPKPFQPQPSTPAKPLPAPGPGPTFSPLPKGFADQVFSSNITEKRKRPAWPSNRIRKGDHRGFEPATRFFARPTERSRFSDARASIS